MLSITKLKLCVMKYWSLSTIHMGSSPNIDALIVLMVILVFCLHSKTMQLLVILVVFVTKVNWKKYWNGTSFGGGFFARVCTPRKSENSFVQWEWIWSYCWSSWLQFPFHLFVFYHMNCWESYLSSGIYHLESSRLDGVMETLYTLIIQLNRVLNSKTLPYLKLTTKIATIANILCSGIDCNTFNQPDITSSPSLQHYVMNKYYFSFSSVINNPTIYA